MRTKTIILASVLGGTGILFIPLIILALFVRHRRRRQRRRTPPPPRQEHRISHHHPGHVSTTSWITFRASGGGLEDDNDAYHLDRPPRTSETRTIRPVTPSPSRLPSPQESTATSLTITRTPPPFLATVTRWDLEKAAATTPPGHPAMSMSAAAAANLQERRQRRQSSVSRVAAGLHFAAGGQEHEYTHQSPPHRAHVRQYSQTSTIDAERRQQQYLVPLPLLPSQYLQPLSPPPSHPPPPPPPLLVPQPSRENNASPQQQQHESISSAFAAEMSSLLDSISFKSSYSSLRSGGTGDRSSTAASSSGHGPTGLSAPPPIHAAATARGPS